MAKKKKTKKKREVTRCVEMFTDEVSLVDRGANGHKKWLMVKSDGEIGHITIDDVEKAVPGKDATREAKEKARAARSKKYGIEVLPKNSNLTYPADAPSTERLYGDSVNLKYPLAYKGDNKPDVARTRNAIARFKQASSTYKDKASRNRVYERIVRAAMSAGIKVTVDPKDPIDSALPGDIKTRLSKNNDTDGTDTDLQVTGQDTADVQDGESTSDWLNDLTKSIDGTDEDSWLDDARSAIDSVGEDQEPDNLNKEDDSGDDDSDDEPSSQDTPEQGDESDTSEETANLAKLQKEAEEKDAQIKKLQKSITALKAKTIRLSTGIGVPNTMRPGEDSSSKDRDTIEDRNPMIDLSPDL